MQNLREKTSGRVRSSRSQLLFKIGFKYFTNFTRKDLCWSLFLIKETQTRVISCEICKFFKNTFFSERLFWLLVESIVLSSFRLEACNFIKKETPAQMLFSDLWNFKTLCSSSPWLFLFCCPCKLAGRRELCQIYTNTYSFFSMYL